MRAFALIGFGIQISMSNNVRSEKDDSIQRDELLIHGRNVVIYRVLEQDREATNWIVMYFKRKQWKMKRKSPNQKIYQKKSHQKNYSNLKRKSPNKQKKLHRDVFKIPDDCATRCFETFRKSARSLPIGARRRNKICTYNNHLCTKQ